MDSIARSMNAAGGDRGHRRATGSAINRQSDILQGQIKYALLRWYDYNSKGPLS